MKKIIFVLTAIAFWTASCDDILEKKPLDTVSDGVLWEDAALMDKYLLACYSDMYFYFETHYGAIQEDIGPGYPFIALGISDEANSTWIGTAKSHWINIGGGVYEWWGYPVVRRLNIFLDRIQNSPYTEDQLRQRDAEARFLRAFAYFNMVKRYGGVPLILEEVKLDSPDELLYPVRAKEEAVYRFIIDELNDIIDNKLLPESYGGADLGRPTIWAAAALKSRAAMYAGSIATWGTVKLDGIVGIPQAKASYFWQQSLDASNYILGEGPFDLYRQYFAEDKSKNYRNIFIDENNSEVIFSEIYDGRAGKGHSFDMFNNPGRYNTWGGGQGYCVYLEFVESYENTDDAPGVPSKIDRDKIAAGYFWTMNELFGKKDPRFEASVYTHGTNWTHNGADVVLDYHQGVYYQGQWYENEPTPNGIEPVGFSQLNGYTSPFGIKKYLNQEEAMIPERRYSHYDYIIFRLAEIYLNKAEAAMELGDEPTARAAVNEIRRRVGMTEYSSAITKDNIRQERKIELAFEGNRYWDLRRWRIAQQVLSPERTENNQTESWTGLHYRLDGETGKVQIRLLSNVAGTQPTPYFSEMHYYLPISRGRTAANPNLVENPDYR